MKKYCLRREGTIPSPFGPRGDVIWELDEDNNYIRTLYGWPKKGEFGTIVLKAVDSYRRWYKVGEITDRLLHVRIGEVKGLTPGQIKAIQKDLAEGVIEQRLYKRDA